MGGAVRGGGQGGCVNKELKFFVKIKKKIRGVGGGVGVGGVRVDVNKELNFFEN